MQPHPALSVIIAIVIAILTASFLFSVGYAFIEQPEYNDFCGDVGPYPGGIDRNATEQEIEQHNQEQQECSDQYQEAQDQARNSVFYIVSILGVIVIIGGLFLHSSSVNLRFYLTSGVIFGALAAILISTMMNWSVFTRYVRPFVLLGEIVLVVVVAIMLFSKRKK